MSRKHWNETFRYLPFLFFLVLSCQVRAQQSHIRYVGSSTIGNFIKDASSIYSSSDFSLDTEPESAGGEKAIIEGKTDLAGVANIPNPSTLNKGVLSTLIGYDAIGVIVHEGNPIRNLTLEQLKGIFTGKIKNWSELGGNDLEIKPFIVDIESATHKVFRSVVLGNENYRSTATISPDSAMLKKIKGTPGGIGHMSFSFLKNTDGIRIPMIDGQQLSLTNKEYPITRPLYLLWWSGRKDISQFIDWTLSRKGQRLLMQRFVGLWEGPAFEENKSGVLIVYTETYPVDDGGTFYYPHKGYDILSANHKLIKHVPNHHSPKDESPTIINLPPGNYIITPENSSNRLKEHYVTLSTGQLTKLKTYIQQSNNLISTEEGVEVLEGDDLKVNPLQFYGDIRLRAEQDWNSRNFNGSFRDDRFRLRYRLRFGFTYDWTKNISLGARIRSGVDESLQSPHNNFGHREFTGVPINLDKVFLAGKYDKFWWWAGKNSFPFWKQNELFWDDDVTPEGIALGGSFKVNSVSIKPKAAYFITNTGSGNFDPRDPTNGMIDGHMLGGQLELGFTVKENKVTLANGYYALKDINNVPTTDFFYSGDRFKLDYSFVVSGLNIELKTKIPIAIGFDHFTNLEDYGEVPDTLMNPVYKDQNTGFVISAKMGKLSEKGDWLFGYYFARKEEYSVVSYYTEDDWIRLGNINRNRNTNYKGHEIRVAYAFDSRFNVVARAYFVEGLVTHDVAKESGNRFRLDFNMKFNKQVR